LQLKVKQVICHHKPKKNIVTVMLPLCTNKSTTTEGLLSVTMSLTEDVT